MVKSAWSWIGALTRELAAADQADALDHLWS
jgi:hypothetical protein